MQDRARAVLVAVVFVAVIGVPLAILFASGGDDEPEAKPKPAKATGLRLEVGTSSDLVVYVKPAANVPARAGGRSEVVLRCVDSDGDTVMAQDEQWPFQDTDQFAVGPHAHMTLDPLSITAVERCLVEGTEPLLQAPVPR
jgi:hypothetical protein